MENLKIKTLKSQIVTLINASELPISTLYLMMNGITQELQMLFELQCSKEQEQLNTENSIEVIKKQEEENTTK